MKLVPLSSRLKPTRLKQLAMQLIVLSDLNVSGRSRLSCGDAGLRAAHLLRAYSYLLLAYCCLLFAICYLLRAASSSKMHSAPSVRLTPVNCG